MLTTEVWIGIVSGLVTLVGTLFVLGYHEISRRLGQLEKQDSRMAAAIVTLLVAKDTDHEAIASALHRLLVNGVERVD